MKTMTAKFPGVCCCGCGKAIKRGDEINFWGRGQASLTACTVDPAKVNQAPPRQSAGSRYTRFSGGGEHYVNRRGRCEDAPCCGCCS